jgi:RNA polymerase sigma-70 factor (ECF subfamily)
MSAEDETRLIEQVRAGNRESFRILVETHQQQVFRICYHLLKDGGNAEDLAQETFVTAFRKISQFDPDRGRFSTWLIVIAKRLCLNALRTITPIPMAEPPGGSAPPRDSPDRRAERSETFRALDAALAKLSDEHRRAFIFSEIEELPHEEIARIENIAPGTVKSRVSRAKLALQGELRTTYGELT